MSFAWLNGDFIPEAEPRISLRDTGLLHAAGLFTTFRAHAGRIFRLKDHLARLRRSCEVLYIPLLYKDDLLTAAATELLHRNNLTDARMRLTVTRGASQPDPLHGLRLSPTTFMTATSFEPYPDEYYEKGMTVIALDDQKLNPYDIQAGHKTLNYFSRLSALRDATQRGAGEALWFNVHNYLQSGSISNIFIVKDGVLITPPTREDLLDPAIAERVPYPRSATLPGITRQVVLELAAGEHLPLERSAITIDRLLAADEAFLTNSVMGIMPLARAERSPIGDDKPGPLTRRLIQLYATQLSQ
ncbi:MAG TPA: aminotransferase class IV [Tepidisphaeraceae bacterium]|jgi:branched-chain amino acid aminotransferase|nr:aminotransferase class IV [Tepidisphaeraceae bacterium]